MQDDQFNQNKIIDFQNLNNQPPFHPDMVSMQQPPRRDNQPTMRGNQPPMRKNQPPMRGNRRSPFTPPPPLTPPMEGGGQQPPAPRSAPPTFSPQIPSRQDGARGIRSCLYRNTFIWLNNSNSFWFYPTFVGRQAVAGFRWRGSGWTFQRINLDRIRSFQCF
ncbi:MAG: hypothetical protein WCD89_11075 [Anaerocolumna sp.]